MPDPGTPNTGSVTTGTRCTGSATSGTLNTGSTSQTVNTGAKTAGTTVTGTISASTANVGAITEALVNVGAINPLGPRPNIVLMLFDDGGLDKFNWSGLLEPASGHALTPRLDEMRARGVTFLRAYANPICHPTRAAIHTGRYAFRTGAGGNIEAPDDYRFGIDPDTGLVTEIMLPRAVRLGSNGTDDMTIGLLNFTYAAACFGKWHLCSDDGYETHAVDIGYGRYIGCQPNAYAIDSPSDPNSGHYHFNEVNISFGGGVTEITYGDDQPHTPGGGYAPGQPNQYFKAWDESLSPKVAWDAYKVLRDAVGWMNTRTQPFICTINFNPPHEHFDVPPYTAPDTIPFGVGNTGGDFNLLSSATQTAMDALGGPGYRAANATENVAIHNAMTEAIDSLIGHGWDRMDPIKRDNTVFIWIGDNGTVPTAQESPYNPQHSKRSVYEQGVHVPMIVWGSTAHITSPGRTTSNLTHAVDVFPTIMELTQSDAALWNPDGVTIDGRSFAALLKNASATPHRNFILSEFFLPLTATLENDDINQVTWHRAYSNGTHKLYRKPDGVVPPYEMYRVTSENQPESGQPGYLELAADNLYPLVDEDGDIAAIFNELSAAMDAVYAS